MHNIAYMRIYEHMFRTQWGDAQWNNDIYYLVYDIFNACELFFYHYKI